MRASVLWVARAVTRSCSSPLVLMLPANTASPGALSTGMLSPVIGAWLMALQPSVTTPSSGTRSPGFRRTCAFKGTAATGMGAHAPPGCRTSAMGGVKSSKPLMALRARSTALASIHSAIAYSAITMAASGHWPIKNAPVTATAISALMPSLPRSSAAMPFL